MIVGSCWEDRYARMVSVGGLECLYYYYYYYYYYDYDYDYDYYDRVNENSDKMVGKPEM